MPIPILKVENAKENINKEKDNRDDNKVQLIEENQDKIEEKEHTELIKVEEKWYQKLFTWLKKLVNKAKI